MEPLSGSIYVTAFCVINSRFASSETGIKTKLVIINSSRGTTACRVLTKMHGKKMPRFLPF